MIPEGGFRPAPAIPQPNIYPMEWRVDSQKLADIYERSKVQLWNPTDLPWDDLDPDDVHPRAAARDDVLVRVLANFDASGPAVFARATIHAFEMHEEDPVRKCFFSITRDEMNHEEGCQRAIQRCAGRAARLGADDRPGAGRAQQHRWLYHNGGRYWTGYTASLGKYPMAVLFTCFMMGEVASSTLFRGMATGPSTRSSRRSSPASAATSPATCDLHPAPREGLAGARRRHQAADHPAAAGRLRVPVDDAVGAAAAVLGAARLLPRQPPGADRPRPRRRARGAHLRRAGRELAAGARAGGQIVERWGIEFPAIPELDLDGVDVGDIDLEDIIPVF